DPATSDAPYRVFNIGNHAPVDLMAFIEAIERAVGQPAHKRFVPLRAGDMLSTFADMSELAEWTGFRPATPMDVGVGHFVRWYRDYFRA
ncbi:MAG: protein CapI, partial [Burkholderiaceae bacterium]